EAAPPHASELLETEMFRVVEWLEDRAKALLEDSTDDTSSSEAAGAVAPIPRLQKDGVVAIALSRAGDVRGFIKLNDCIFESDNKKANEKKKQALESVLKGATLVVDARVAGLHDGLLDPKMQIPPRTVDDEQEWLPPTDNRPVIRYRVRL